MKIFKALPVTPDELREVGVKPICSGFPKPRKHCMHYINPSIENEIKKTHKDGHFPGSGVHFSTSNAINPCVILRNKSKGTDWGSCLPRASAPAKPDSSCSKPWSKEQQNPDHHACSRKELQNSSAPSQLVHRWKNEGPQGEVCQPISHNGFLLTWDLSNTAHSHRVLIMAVLLGHAGPGDMGQALTLLLSSWIIQQSHWSKNSPNTLIFPEQLLHICWLQHLSAWPSSRRGGRNMTFRYPTCFPRE